MSQDYNSFIRQNSYSSKLFKLNALHFNEQLAEDKLSTINPLLRDKIEKFAAKHDPYAFLEEEYSDLAVSWVETKDYKNTDNQVIYEALGLTVGDTFDDLLNKNLYNSNQVLRKVFKSSFIDEFGNPETDQIRASFFGRVFDRNYQNSIDVDDSNIFRSAFAPALTELVNRNLVSAPYDYDNTDLELQRLNREYNLNDTLSYLGTGYLENQVGDKPFMATRRIFDSINYVTKPGVLPPIGLIQGAQKDLTIDIYQLQNSTIRNYIVVKLLNIHNDPNRTEDFNLTIRMATPVEDAASTTSYDILGPNLIFYQTLQRLNDEFRSSNSKVKINLSWAGNSGKKSHPKFLLTENAAIITTANITDPRMTSLYQTGSNYEATKVIHKSFRVKDHHIKEFDKLAAQHDFETAYDALVNYARQDTSYSSSPFSGFESKDYLYFQARYLKKYMTQAERMPLSTGVSNIGGPTETYKNLRETLDTVSKFRDNKKNAVFYGFLNQTFLLQYQPPEDKLISTEQLRNANQIQDEFYEAFNNQYRGEMGPDFQTDHRKYQEFLKRNIGRFRNEIQDPLFNLLIEGGARITVDPHNYDQTVIAPLYDNLKRLGLLSSSNNFDVEKFIWDAEVDRKATAQKQIDTLRIYISSKKPDISTETAEHLSKMTLALFSGNIQYATTPFFHSKLYGAFLFNNLNDNLNIDINNIDDLIEQGNLTLISGKLGSGNLSPRSLDALNDSSYNDIASEALNSELDFLLFNNNLRQAQQRLRNEETDLFNEEAKSFTKLIHRTLTEATNRGLGLKYNDVNQGEIFRRQVDRTKLEELYKSLDNLSNESMVNDRRLFTVHREFDEKGLKDIIVKTDGRRFRFTVVGDNVKEFGLYSVMAVNSGKMINRIAVNNLTDEDLHLGFTGDSNSTTRTVVRKNERIRLNPIQATTSLIATLVLEQEQLKYIKNPISFIRKHDINFDFNLDELETEKTKRIANYVGNFLINLLDLEIDTYHSKVPINKKNKRIYKDISVLKQSAVKQRALKRITKFQQQLVDPKGLSKYILSIVGSDFEFDYDARKREIVEYVSLLTEFVQEDARRDDVFKQLVSKTVELVSSNRRDLTDLVYYFVNFLDHSENNKELKKQKKLIAQRLLQPTLTPTQQRVYSSVQSAAHLPLYGLGRQDTEVTHVYNSATQKLINQQKGIHTLTSMAIMGMPASFGPQSYVGEGPASFVKVAEGASVSLKDPIAKDYNLIPFYSEGKIGTRFDISDTEFLGEALNIITEARVGITIDAAMFSRYVTSITGIEYTNPNDVYDALVDIVGPSDSDDMLDLLNVSDFILKKGRRYTVYNFKKLGHVSQRLKNVLGARPLMSLSDHYSLLLEGKGDMQTLIENYISTKFDKTIPKDKVDIITRIEGKESLKNAAIFSGEISTFLGPKALIVLNQMSSEIKEEYKKQGFTEDEIEYILPEVLRVRAVNNELFGTTKGFIGASLVNSLSDVNKKVSPVMLIALSGGFSDFGYSNPYFGYNPNFGDIDDWSGRRVAFLDQATKSLKSSLMKADFSDLSTHGIIGATKNTLPNLIQTDDRVIYDLEQRFAAVYDSQGNLKKIINTRAELDVISGAIEKSVKNTGSTAPSVGIVTASSSVLTNMGEEGVEHIFLANTLSGSKLSNEIRKHISFIRSVVGSNRRIDSLSGGLIKSPLIMLSSSFWKNSLAPTLNDMGIDLGAVHSILSPSNIKSYLFEHGSNLLTRESNIFENTLNSLNTSTLVASLLLAFDKDSFSNIDNIDVIYDNIYALARSNTKPLGDFIYRAAKLFEFNNPNASSDKFFDEFRSSKQSNPLNLRFKAGALREALQQLANDPSKLNDTNPASNNNLLNVLKSILKPGEEKLYLGQNEGTKVDYLSLRERAYMAGNLELIMQILKPNRIKNFPLVPKLSGPTEYGKTALHPLANIFGANYKDLQEDELLVSNFIEGLSNNFPVIRLFVGANPSQSKNPVSSKKTANIELQELLANQFLSNASIFQSSGNLEAMRKAVTGIYSLMTGMSINEFYNVSTSDTLDLVSLSMYDHTTDKHVIASKIMNDFLSFYSSSDLKNKNLIKQAKYLMMFSYLDWDKIGKEQILAIHNKVSKNPVFKNLALELIDLANAFQQGSTTEEKYKARKNLRGLFATAFYEKLEEIHSLAAHYDLKENKTLAIDRGETIISSLIGTNIKTSSFMFPSLTFRGTRDGNYAVIPDYDNMNYGIFLGPSIVRTLGEQFAGFQSELAKAAISLYESLIPGSLVFNTFRKIQKAQMKGELGTLLTAEEKQALEQFQETNVNFFELASDELTGSIIQQIMGNKVKTAGTNAVIVSSMFLGPRETTIPKIIDSKFGVVSENDPRYKLAKQFTSDLSDPRFNGNKVATRYLMQGLNALINGMSNKNDLIQSYSNTFKSMRASITSELGLDPNVLKGDLTNYRTKIENRRKELQSLEDTIHNIKLDGKGDTFLKTLFQLEIDQMKLMVDKAAIFTENADVILNDDTRIQEIDRKLTLYRSLPKIFTGFLGTESTKAFVQSEQLMGKLGGIDLHGNIHKKIKSFISDPSGFRDYLETLKISVDTSIKDTLDNFHLLDEDKAILSETNKIVQEYSSYLGRKIKMMDHNVSLSNPIPGLAKDLEVETIKFISHVNTRLLNIKRSPPPGYLHITTTGHVKAISINDVNDRIKNDYGIDNFFAPSETLNKNTALANPFSYLVPNLGDYDGDNATFIFSNIIEAETNLADLIYQIVKLQKLKQETVSNKTLDANKRKKLIESYEKKLTQKRERATKEQYIINKYKSTNSYEQFNEKLLNWVSDYTKMDKEYLSSMNTHTILTLVTQSSGLYPNMEDAYNKSREYNTLFKESLNEYIQSNQTSNLKDFLINSSVDNYKLVGNYLTLLGDEEYKILSDELDSLIKTNHSDPSNPKDITSNGKIQAIIGMATSRMYEDHLIGSNVKKLNQLGTGLLTPEDTMDLMNKVLGKAGSVLLGKTYNNTIGLLYQQSPILAIAASLEKGGNFETILTSFLNDTANKDKTDTIKKRLDLNTSSSTQDVLNRFKQLAAESRRKVERLGGTVQQIHQILRDSIKPKNNISEFLTLLDNKIDEYLLADDKNKDKLLKELGSTLAIEPLYKLDTFIASFQDLNKNFKETQNENSLEGVLNANEFKSEQKSLVQVLEDVLNTSDVEAYRQDFFKEGGIQELAISELKAKGSYSEQEIKDISIIKQGAILASYNVKQSIVDLVTDFAIQNSTANPETGNSAIIGLTKNLEKAERQGRKQQLDRLIKFFDTNATSLPSDLEAKEFQEFLHKNNNYSHLLDNISDEHKNDYKYNIATQFLNSRENLNNIFGVLGDRFINLMTASKLRINQAKNGTRDIDGSLDLKNDPLMQLIYQNMQTGKIENSEDMSKIFSALFSYHLSNTGGDVSQSSILRSTISGIRQSDINRIQHDSTESKLIDSILIALQNDDVAASMIDDTRATALGNTTSLVKGFMGQVFGLLHMKDKAKEIMGEAHNTNMSNKENSTTTKNLLIEVLGDKLGSQMHQYVNESVHPDFFIDPKRQKELENILNVISKSRTKTEQKVLNDYLNKSDSVSSLAEIGLFPMLALVGNLISSGNPTGEQIEQSIQQTVGNSIMAFAYTKSGNSALGQALGSGFKVRMLTRNSDNPFMDMANLTVQELGGMMIYKTLEAATGRTNKIINSFVDRYLNTDKLLNNVLTQNVVSDPFEKHDTALKKGIKDIGKNVVAGAAHMVISNVINTVFRQAEQLTSAEALSQIAQPATEAEMDLNSAIIQYNASNNKQAISDQEQIEVTDDTNQQIDYQIQEDFASNFVTQTNSYYPLDNGFELVTGNTSPDLYSISFT